MPGRPRTRARKAVEAEAGTLVGPGVSPKATAMVLAARISDAGEAREGVLAMCLDLMGRAADDEAYIAAAAFANILLRELKAPEGVNVRDEDTAVAYILGICAAQPGFRAKLVAALEREPHAAPRSP